jgi:hypothetical protein
MIKFGVQIHGIMQSINKVFRSGANKVTTQAHGGGNPPGWTNTGSHWVSGSGDNVETFIDKLEQDGYQINRDENDWNNGSPKKHGMHKFDLYNLLKSAGYNDQNLTDREVSIPLAAIEKLAEKRAAKANVSGTGNEWLAAKDKLDKSGIQVMPPIETTEESLSAFWNGDREWESPNGTVYSVDGDGRIRGLRPIIGYPPDIGLGGPIRIANTLKNFIPQGFKHVKKFGYPHGQKVYEYNGKYYSKDVDSHNGGVWKVFEEVGGKLKRIGTADESLKIFNK